MRLGQLKGGAVGSEKQGEGLTGDHPSHEREPVLGKSHFAEIPRQRWRGVIAKRLPWPMAAAIIFILALAAWIAIGYFLRSMF